MIAAKYPTLGHVVYAGEPFGQLWLATDDEAMEVNAHGASVVLHELRKGVVALTDGSGSFEAWDPGGGYGVALLLDRIDDRLVATRKQRDLLDRRAIETTWPEFASAVDRFEEWYHTEYLAEASWLLLLEDIQDMRRKAGYPPTGLSL